jgi:type VI protein secretion system component Hcp
MTNASLRLSGVSTAIAIAFALTAAPAGAAGYLKLGSVKPVLSNVEGGQANAAGSHRDEIIVESYSWGMSQTGSHRGGGKMHLEDVSTAAKEGKGGNVEFEWKVEEGESARPRPTRPSDVTMKRGTSSGQQAAPSSGIERLIGVSQGTHQNGQATVSKSMDKASTKLVQPASRGSMTAIVPAGMCRVGARYPTAELGTGQRVYRMTGVVVTSCSTSGSGSGSDMRPMESISMNYDKIVWK